MLPWNQLQRILSKNFESQLQRFITQKLVNSSLFRYFAQRTHRTLQDVKENPERVFQQAQKQQQQYQQQKRIQSSPNEKGFFSVLREEAAKELSELNPLSKRNDGNNNKKDRF